MNREREYITGISITDDTGKEVKEKGDHTHGGPVHSVTVQPNQTLIGF